MASAVEEQASLGASLSIYETLGSEPKEPTFSEQAHITFPRPLVKGIGLAHLLE